MRKFKTRFGLRVESMETRVVLSTMALVPAMREAGAPAAEVERPVGTPMVFSRDTVRIQNNTGFHINVTARLMVSGGQKPTISRRIGPNGVTDTFSFSRHTDDFIWIEVRRVGGTSPPPLTISLNKPLGGYYGKLFTVSQFGGYFNVSG